MRHLTKNKTDSIRSAPLIIIIVYNEEIPLVFLFSNLFSDEFNFQFYIIENG